MILRKDAKAEEGEKDNWRDHFVEGEGGWVRCMLEANRMYVTKTQVLAAPSLEEGDRMSYE